MTEGYILQFLASEHARVAWEEYSHLSVEKPFNFPLLPDEQKSQVFL